MFNIHVTFFPVLLSPPRSSQKTRPTEKKETLKTKTKLPGDPAKVSILIRYTMAPSQRKERILSPRPSTCAPPSQFPRLSARSMRRGGGGRRGEPPPNRKPPGWGRRVMHTDGSKKGRHGDGDGIRPIGAAGGGVARSLAEAPGAREVQTVSCRRCRVVSETSLPSDIEEGTARRTSWIIPNGFFGVDVTDPMDYSAV